MATVALWVNGAPAGLPPAEEPGSVSTVPAVVVQSHGEVDPTEIPLVEDPTPAEPVSPYLGNPPAPLDRLLWHLADPIMDREQLEQAMFRSFRGASTSETISRRYVDSVLAHINMPRPKRITLTLSEALQRAMEHNLSVRIESYNPAIEMTRVVEAEAQFDPSFVANLVKNKQNQPTASALVGSNVDSLNMSAGFAKMTATGAQVGVRQELSRLSNDFAFQQLNPVWSSAFVFEVRQPFLRGFGIDFNRSLIHLSRLDQRISYETFRRQVIQTLVDVEQAYWNLVAARRDVVITGRVLASFEQIYDFLDQRRTFDAYKVQLADTKARLERTKAQYEQVKANVRNAEDRLLNLLNDPELDLASDVEIIPLDFPNQVPFMLDRLTEVQTALDYRTELAESNMRVKQARIAVGQAKNQVLPQFDVTFRYTVDGLGPSAHRAFSEVTKNDFHEYFISLEFELPLSNRARRAALRRAQIQQAQSMAVLKSAIENVILDVNINVRQVQVDFDQIGPVFQSVEANQEQVEAIRARAETKSFVELNQELSAIQSLGQARRELMQVLIGYQMSIVELERAKGTLPEFNNVILSTDGD
jgi:outer membrane protein TolC